MTKPKNQPAVRSGAWQADKPYGVTPWAPDKTTDMVFHLVQPGFAGNKRHKQAATPQLMALINQSYKSKMNPAR